jgi:hypothetical protein
MELRERWERLGPRNEITTKAAMKNAVARALLLNPAGKRPRKLENDLTVSVFNTQFHFIQLDGF